MLWLISINSDMLSSIEEYTVQNSVVEENGFTQRISTSDCPLEDTRARQQDHRHFDQQPPSLLRKSRSATDELVSCAHGREGGAHVSLCP